MGGGKVEKTMPKTCKTSDSMPKHEIVWHKRSGDRKLVPGRRGRKERGGWTTAERMMNSKLSETSIDNADTIDTHT